MKTRLLIIVLFGVILVACGNLSTETGVSSEQYAMLIDELDTLNNQVDELTETILALEANQQIDPVPTNTPQPTATNTPAPDFEATIEIDQEQLSNNSLRIDEVAALVEEIATQIAVQPSPTPENTPRPQSLPSLAATATSAPENQQSALETLNSTRQNIQEYGGLIDRGLARGYVKCPSLIAAYVSVQNVARIAGNTVELQNAAQGQENAISVFSSGTRDSYETCVAHVQQNQGVEIVVTDRITGEKYVFPADEVYVVSPGNLNFDLARIAVNDAIDTLMPGIIALGGE